MTVDDKRVDSVLCETCRASLLESLTLDNHRDAVFSIVDLAANSCMEVDQATLLKAFSCAADRKVSALFRIESEMPASISTETLLELMAGAGSHESDDVGVSSEVWQVGWAFQVHCMCLSAAYRKPPK